MCCFPHKFPHILATGWNPQRQRNSNSHAVFQAIRTLCERTYHAWKAGTLAIELHPQTYMNPKWELVQDTRNRR